MCKIKFWCLVTLVPFTIAAVERSEENYVQLIVDLSKSYERPTSITAFLCFSPHERLKLFSKLGNLKRHVTVVFTKSSRRLKNLKHDTLIVADLKCPNALRFLTQANENKVFNKPLRWLLIEDISDNSSIFSKGIGINVMLDSEVIIATKNLRGDFEMKSIYKINEKGKLFFEEYGIWSNVSGLHKNKLQDLVPVIRRRDLAGQRIAVAFNIDDKFTGTFEGEEALEISNRKIFNAFHAVTTWGSILVPPLYDFMNATRVNVITDNWGYYVNGTWNGIVGKMEKEEVDISGTPIFMTKARADIVNYLINPTHTMVRFVFREPPLSYQNNLFLLPFDSTVWYSLGALVVVLIVVIYAYAQWEWSKAEVLNDNDFTANEKLTLSDVVMIIVGAISQQGSFVQLRGAMGRLVMFTLFLAFLFLFTAYSASIVALLQSSSKQIRTLSDLLNSKLELGVENNSYNIYYFTKATDPVRKAIYETKVAPRGSKPKFMNITEGVKRLQKHPFAFNMDIGTGYKIVEEYFYEHEKCGLQEIAYIPPYKPWITCRKNSPYKELIKIGFYRLHEHGMAYRANRMVFRKRPVCAVKGANFDSVSIVDMYPSLLMLLCGMAIAVGLLVIEVLVHRRRMKVLEDEDMSDNRSNLTCTSIE